MVAPVILVSVISGLISLNDKEKMKKIGTKSVFWLLITSVTAIVVTLVVGAVTNIGKGAGAIYITEEFFKEFIITPSDKANPRLIITDEKTKYTTLE